MPTLTDPAVIKELLQRHGFSFSRALGQNFIINPGVCPKMAELGGAAPGVGVLEIGPGFGVLTAELCRRAEKVVAIELDDRLPPILAETLAEFKNVTIVQGDAMVLDLPALLEEHFAGMPVVVCANLPYYITSPIIMRLLEGPLPIRSLTVMVQKEAAVRITAAPGTRECGAISAAVWYYSTPKLLFPVSRGSFLPAPAVDSAVIRLDLPQELPEDLPPREDFFAVVRAGFGQRRKTDAQFPFRRAAVGERRHPCTADGGGYCRKYPGGAGDAGAVEGADAGVLFYEEKQVKDLFKPR